jgi:hypothetical protein
MNRLIPVCLALLLSAVARMAVAVTPAPVPQLNFDPPRIVVSHRPARLMHIDGPPATVPIPATGLEFVVNTDWDVFRHLGSDTWYILDGAHWISNTMLSGGDWRPTADLPDGFLTLQVSSDWPRVAAAMPPRVAESKPLPIVISYEPTELIVVDGDMDLQPVAGGLSYVANTGSDLFHYDGRYYYLTAGRWFTTKDVDRKWYAVQQLPEVFAEIPPGHARERVLVSVPGTEAANRAAEEAAKPRVTEVEPQSGDGIEVVWAGKPRFVGIKGTPLQRGENTPFQVIRHNNFHYLCFEGAWYSSSEPRGPWRVARQVPEAIYTIPPSDPAFNVTFVRLEAFDDSSGRAAYVSTGGYYNRYYTGSTVVYGTGWYHPAYYDRSVYWRYPYSYGHYGPWGAYWPYHHRYSETREFDRTETDWEWSLDGGKRRVYTYGPTNYVGGTYVKPASNIHQAGGRE